MIHIITGNINSFKTTRLKALYKTNQLGDGFVSIKQMKDNHVLYYQLERLKDQSLEMFIINTLYHRCPFRDFDQLGPYAFDKSVFKEVEQITADLIDHQVSPLYIDEIGLLELKHRGFYKTLSMMVDSGLDVYFTCRKSHLDDVLETFAITDYKIIK